MPFAQCESCVGREFWASREVRKSTALDLNFLADYREDIEAVGDNVECEDGILGFGDDS